MIYLEYSRYRFDSNTGVEPTGIAMGDLNGDGVLDLLTSQSGNNTVSALIADGNTVTPSTSQTFAESTALRPTKKSDLTF